MMADVQTKQLEEAVGSITKSGRRVKAVTLNVTDFDAIKTLVDDETKSKKTPSRSTN